MVDSHSDSRDQGSASLRIIEISHEYALLFQQLVASSFPSVENDTQITSRECWRGEPMGKPLSRFHSRAVLSQHVLAMIGPFGDIAIPQTLLVYDVIHAHLLLRGLRAARFLLPLVFAQSARHAFAIETSFSCALKLLARCSVARF
jgi:hypothetical protein